MQIKNLVDYSISSVQSLQNQMVVWGGRTISLIQTNPVAAVITCLAAALLGIIALGYYRCKKSYQEVQALLVPMKKEMDHIDNDLNDIDDDLENVERLIRKLVEKQKTTLLLMNSLNVRLEKLEKSHEDAVNVIRTPVKARTPVKQKRNTTENHLPFKAVNKDSRI